jgi:hypothetical protein
MTQDVSRESPLAEAERQEEFRQRTAMLLDAIGQLPTDSVTLSALIDVAVSTVLTVTLDPSAARIMFDARLRDYEGQWGPPSRRLRLSH